MSSNIKVKRICVYCSSEFIAKTTSTRYCSKKCNTAHYKAKARTQKVEQSNTETKRIRNKPIQDIQEKEFLTVKDVSILLGCSIRSAYRLIDNGTLREEMSRSARRRAMELFSWDDTGREFVNLAEETAGC